MARSSMAVFSALWRAYGEGRLDRSLHLVDPACEVTLPDGHATFRGHDGVRECLDAARREWKTLTITYDDIHEEHPGCVVGIGRVAASSPDGKIAFERPLACVAEIRDGRLVRARVFGEPADALGYAREVEHRSGGEHDRGGEPDRGAEHDRGVA
jgi:ketosteroid isomerase-like protein